MPSPSTSPVYTLLSLDFALELSERSCLKSSHDLVLLFVDSSLELLFESVLLDSVDLLSDLLVFFDLELPPDGGSGLPPGGGGGSSSSSSSSFLLASFQFLLFNLPSAI